MIALAYLGPYLPVLAAGLVWMAVLLRADERRGGDDDAPAPRPTRPDGRLVEFWRSPARAGWRRSPNDLAVAGAAADRGAALDQGGRGVRGQLRYLAMAAMAAVAIRQVLAPKLSELLAAAAPRRTAAAYQTTTSWMVALNWPIYLAC